jgi:hypothetical protein
MTIDLDALEAAARAIQDSLSEHGEPFEGHHDARLAFSRAPYPSAVLELVAEVRRLRAARDAGAVYQEREDIRRVSAEDRESYLRAGLIEALDVAGEALDRIPPTQPDLEERIADLRKLVEP